MRSASSTRLGSRPSRATIPSVITLFTSSELKATIAELMRWFVMFSASRGARLTDWVASFRLTMTPLERP